MERRDIRWLCNIIFLISPAAEKAKARGRHAGLEKNRPQAPGNVGIQATQVPLSRVLNRGEVHACQR